MKVLVISDCKFTDTKVVHTDLAALDRTRGPVTHVLVSDAGGAPYHAKYWARNNNRQAVVFGTNWGHYPGKHAASLARNTAMLELKPDLILLYSPGDAVDDMRSKATAAGIPVVEGRID